MGSDVAVVGMEAPLLPREDDDVAGTIHANPTPSAVTEAAFRDVRSEPASRPEPPCRRRTPDPTPDAGKRSVGRYSSTVPEYFLTLRY
jgi:hypothetical protein